MGIKWRSLWYPMGEWVDEQGNAVEQHGNFRCESDGQKLICIMVTVSTPAGHGEPAMTGAVPKFYDEETLEPVEVKGLITVTEK